MICFSIKSSLQRLTNASMVGFFVLFFSLVIGPLTQASANNPEPTSLRMMTYNIRFDTPADGVHAWPNRKELVASVIRFHKADIIGVQEAMEHQIQDLMDAFKIDGSLYGK